MKNKYIQELNLLRALACLSIVLLHSTTQNAAVTSSVQNHAYQFFRVALCYATPTFILISVIILAKNYKDNIPEGFWSKRLQYILIPYLFCAAIDVMIVKNKWPNTDVSQKIIDNFIYGNHIGWFILVILQMYIIFHFVKKSKFDMKIGSILMTFISLAYLWMLRLPIPIIKENLIWLKLLFPAWLGYFAIAYLFGTYYEVISNYIYKKRYYTILLVLISLIILYIGYKGGYISANSRRIDIIPLVISITLLIIAWGQRFTNMSIINFISGCSFGIYLVHWQVQRYIAAYTAKLTDNTFLQVVLLFIVSLIISIIIVKLLSSISIGEYIVGKSNRNNKWKEEATYVRR